MELLCPTFALMVLDVLTGLAAACVRGELSSGVARMGLMHKLAFIGAIALGCVLDYAQGVASLGFPVQLTDTVCVYVMMCETMSITENLARINPELRNTWLLRLFVNDGMPRADEEDGDDDE